YLAGPMRGQKDSNLPAFTGATAYLRGKGYNVFNPAEKAEEAKFTPAEIDVDLSSARREVFALDTEWICREADALVLLPGWIHSKGAVAEKALAEAIGLPVRYMERHDEEWYLF